MNLNDRLRQARLKAGYASAADAARRLGVAYGTYSGHENGARGIKSPDLKKYARAFGVSTYWLEGGVEPNYFQKEGIQVVGEAGTLLDGEVRWFEEKDPQQMILLPRILDQDVSGLQVLGKQLGGVAAEGSMIFFSSEFKEDIYPIRSRLSLCIINNGKTFIRTPYPDENKNRFILELYGFESMRDVEVERAAPILFILTPEGYSLARAENLILADKLEEIAKKYRSSESVIPR